MAFKEVMSLRKNGQIEEAYKMAISDYNQNQNDEWAKRALSWCIYDELKSNESYSNRETFISKLSELKALDMPEDETMIWNNIVWPINAFVRDCTKSKNVSEEIYDKLFDCIKEFHFVKPSLEYSVLLKAFLSAKEWKGIYDFCEWWNFENFREEDYECENLPDGKKMPISMVESAYLACAKVLINSKDKEAISAFIPKLQQLAEKYPQMQYPNYYVGKLLLASGSDKQEAITAILPFARKKQSEFWVWQLLAEAFEEDNEKYMACLLRAVHCPTQESFLVRIYLLLVNALKKLQYYADARFYLDKYIQVKRDTQTKVSNEVQNMLKEAWYIEADGQNPTYDLDYMTITNDFLFKDVPETDAVVSFVNKDKKMATVVYGKYMEGYFKFDRFVKKLNVGDSIKIRIHEVSSEGFMKVFSVRVSDTQLISDYCKSEIGTITTNSAHSVYFLKSGNESFYIPSNIADKMHLVVGEPMSAIVLYTYNKKKEQWGWSCVKLNRHKFSYRG